MTRQNIRRSIKEIYDIYCKKSYGNGFTLDSISLIFEIGNEIFLKNNEEEIKKLINQPASNAPDVMDDEPYSFDRTIAIYEQLENKYPEDLLITNQKHKTCILVKGVAMKNQTDSTFFEKLVTQGLVLHFVESVLADSTLDKSIEIAPDKLSEALKQLNIAMDADETLNEWFHQDGLAWSVSYYLVQQHLSYYLGSDASNSFALDAGIFSPWLSG